MQVGLRQREEPRGFQAQRKNSRSDVMMMLFGWRQIQTPPDYPGCPCAFSRTLCTGVSEQQGSSSGLAPSPCGHCEPSQNGCSCDLSPSVKPTLDHIYGPFLIGAQYREDVSKLLLCNLLIYFKVVAGEGGLNRITQLNSSMPSSVLVVSLKAH